MDSPSNNSSPVGRIIPVLIFFAGLIGLFYLYQYLFGPKTGVTYPLITVNQSADKKIEISSDKIPSLFEGGEFTVSTWIYINNWSFRDKYNKHILSIGGKNFDTIRIYIGKYKPKLSVRLHTKETGAVTNGVSKSPTPTDALDSASVSKTFEDATPDSELLDSTPMCDLPEVDLQRWVNLTVAVNGKTVDVYLDGKLSRSCVLPALFKVDTSYQATLLDHGGFGGQISNTTMYDVALNPEAVYKNYMAGPEPITTIGGWFSAFFAPGVSISVSTK